MPLCHATMPWICVFTLVSVWTVLICHATVSRTCMVPHKACHGTLLWCHTVAAWACVFKCKSWYSTMLEQHGHACSQMSWSALFFHSTMPHGHACWHDLLSHVVWGAMPWSHIIVVQACIFSHETCHYAAPLCHVVEVWLCLFTCQAFHSILSRQCGYMCFHRIHTMVSFCNGMGSVFTHEPHCGSVWWHHWHVHRY